MFISWCMDILTNGVRVHDKCRADFNVVRRVCGSLPCLWNDVMSVDWLVFLTEFVYRGLLCVWGHGCGARVVTCSTRTQIVLVYSPFSRV